MSVDLPVEIPCVKLPKPKNLTIPLPFGGELRSFVDATKGPPDDCELVQSLMLQIAPMLAGMTCMFKVLKVIMSLKELLDAKLAPTKIPDVLEAIAGLEPCFLMVTPAGLAPLIAAILRLIIAYITCFIEAFESIYRFKVGLALDSADGNPVLLGSLQCAQDNADNSMSGLMESMAAAQPIMDLVGMLTGIVGLSVSLPSLADIAGEQDPLESIRKLREALQTLEQAIDALPI